MKKERQPLSNLLTSVTNNWVSGKILFQWVKNLLEESKTDLPHTVFCHIVKLFCFQHKELLLQSRNENPFLSGEKNLFLSALTKTLPTSMQNPLWLLRSVLHYILKFVNLILENKHSPCSFSVSPSFLTPYTSSSHPHFPHIGTPTLNLHQLWAFWDCLHFMKNENVSNMQNKTFFFFFAWNCE